MCSRISTDLAATSGVLANTFFSFGINDILSGKPGLINFTRDLLLKTHTAFIPKRTYYH